MKLCNMEQHCVYAVMLRLCCCAVMTCVSCYEEKYFLIWKQKNEASNQANLNVSI